MLQEKLEALAKAGRELSQRMSLAIEAAQAGATLQELIGAGTVERESVRISPLPARREAQGFETLRAASDAALAKEGQRPVIFLANLGSIPKHKARSGFAQNFFEAGGLQALTNDGFASADDAMTAFKASGASLVVICSSDDVYAEMAVDTARKLKEAGAVRVLLAGKPAGQEELSAAGVDGFIYLGANVLEIVGELMSCLGVLS